MTPQIRPDTVIGAATRVDAHPAHVLGRLGFLRKLGKLEPDGLPRVVDDLAGGAADHRKPRPVGLREGPGTFQRPTLTISSPSRS